MTEPPDTAVSPIPDPGSSPGPDGNPPPASGIDIETVQAREANVAQNINQNVTRYDGCTFGSDIQRARELSQDNFEVWDGPDLDRHLLEAVFDSGEVGRLEKALAEHRLLVITGDEEIGEGVIALLLASHLLRRGNTSRALFSRGLGHDVSVSFEKLAGDHGSYTGSVIIFRDAFASRNPDLLRFVQELDSGLLSRLHRRLEAHGTFLILTSDRARVPGEESLIRLKSLKVLEEVAGPGPDLLLRELHQRAERCVRGCNAEDDVREKVDHFLSEHGPRVVAELGTVTRIRRFVDSCLLEAAEGTLSLVEALARVHNREGWLLSTLAQDPESWSFALALILAQAVPAPDGVPWYLFYQLWREIAAHLRRELRLPRGPRKAQELMVDRELLDRVRAEVRRYPDLGLETVRFQDSVDPSLLWEALLGPGRTLVSSLVPLLKRLAEEGEFSVREAAARALGRIGRLDPASLVFPLIYRWSKPKDELYERHVALGRLFQGVLGEGQAGYREACLRQLRRVTLSRTGEDVWPGAVALREIGWLDLDLAVRELVEMLGRGLKESLGELLPVERDLLRLSEEEIRGRFDPGQERLDQALKLAAPLMFEEDALHVLAAVQYAIVGLCFSRGPIRVLAEVKRLLQERWEGKLAPVLTLLVLRTGGIADILGRNKASVAVGSGTWISMNDFLASATFGEEAVERLQETVQAVFAGADAFPGLIARCFKTKLGIVLKSWAQDAVQLDETREVYVELAAGLLASTNEELKDQVFRLLQRDPDFTKEGSKLAELAIDALVRRPAPRPALPAA